MKKIINTDKAPAPIGPYNQAILANNTLYVSGQIAINPNTGDLLKEAPVEEQTTLVMQNLIAIVEEAGFVSEDIVKCSIFVKSMKDFNTINNIYGKYFESNPPARDTVEVSGLPKGVAVEISCIAVR